ncbi:MAG: peptidyl-prolyl cis-trans isomerase [Arenicella sp.]|nr:peptidyl-prolyl cis-trans isomerase [Arenicella sp.]
MWDVKEKTKAGLTACLIVALVVSVYWFSTRNDTGKNSILATIGDREITVEEFSRRLIRRGGGYAGGFSSIDYKNKLLDDLIAHEVQTQYATKAGYADDPDVRRTFERIMVRKMREMELDQQLDAIVVDDAEIRQAYQSRILDFTQAEMVRVAVIHLNVLRGASEQRQIEIYKQAEDILAQALLLPADTLGFGHLAARHSEHQASRYQGGDTGWYIHGQAGGLQQPAVIKAIQTFKQPGSLSDVIEARDGLYLLKLMAVRAEQVIPLDTVRLQIQNTLMVDKREAVEVAWLANLKRTFGAEIEVNNTLLESILPPSGTPDPKPIATPGNLPNG